MPAVLLAWRVLVESLPMDQPTLLRLAKFALSTLRRVNSEPLARAALVLVSRLKTLPPDELFHTLVKVLEVCLF